MKAKDAIVEALKDRGASSIHVLSEVTGKSISRLRRVLAKMEEDGIVYRADKQWLWPVGRPRTLWDLDE